MCMIELALYEYFEYYYDGKAPDAHLWAVAVIEALGPFRLAAALSALLRWQLFLAGDTVVVVAAVGHQAVCDHEQTRRDVLCVELAGCRAAHQHIRPAELHVTVHPTHRGRFEQGWPWCRGAGSSACRALQRFHGRPRARRWPELFRRAANL